MEFFNKKGNIVDIAINESKEAGNKVTRRKYTRQV